MTICLEICIIIAIVSLVMILIGFSLKYESQPVRDSLLGLGFLWLFLDAIFGFGFLCNCVSIKEQQSILIPEEVAKSQYTLYTKCEGLTLATSEAKFVMASNDLIRVKKTVSFNSYGLEIEGDTKHELVIIDVGK